MISIVIPVYNEQNRIGQNIEEIFSYLFKTGLKFEVVIVDDGSLDETAKILSDLKNQHPIRVLTHKKNSGKGAAIKTGIAHARGEIILFTDIDLSVPIDFLGKYLAILTKDVDIIIGTRAKEGAKVMIRQSWLREIMGESFTILSNSILWVGVSDFTCGFKMFRKKAAETIFKRQLIKRWAFDAESLFIARKHHFKIKEVPVVWTHSEGSKVRFPGDLIDSLWGLFMIRINDFWGRYD